MHSLSHIATIQQMHRLSRVFARFVDIFARELASIPAFLISTVSTALVANGFGILLAARGSVSRTWVASLLHVIKLVVVVRSSWRESVALFLVQIGVKPCRSGRFSARPTSSVPDAGNQTESNPGRLPNRNARVPYLPDRHLTSHSLKLKTSPESCQSTN